MPFTGKGLDDERLSQVTGGRTVRGYMEHTVARGETLASIAQKYRVTERELCDLNGLKPASALYVGQIVKVPVHIG